jgi:hypothetical protein
VRDLDTRELDHEAIEAPLFGVAADAHGGDRALGRLIRVAPAALAATSDGDRGGAGSCRSGEADACEERGETDY